MYKHFLQLNLLNCVLIEILGESHVICGMRYVACGMRPMISTDSCLPLPH